MASPQTENGFTQLSNELFEKIIKAKLNGTQYGIILATIRATYGYHKKSRTLGIAFFEVSTGRHRRQIANELNTLIARNILVVKSGYTHGKSRELQLNKDYDTWLDIDRGMSENTHRGIGEFAHRGMSENTH